VIPGLSLRSNPGLKLANAFGVGLKLANAFGVGLKLANAFGVGLKLANAFGVGLKLANAFGVGLKLANAFGVGLKLANAFGVGLKLANAFGVGLKLANAFGVKKNFLTGPVLLLYTLKFALSEVILMLMSRTHKERTTNWKPSARIGAAGCGLGVSSSLPIVDSQFIKF
jgi:predicted outer membrane lipoprotein